MSENPWERAREALATLVRIYDEAEVTATRPMDAILIDEDVVRARQAGRHGAGGVRGGVLHGYHVLRRKGGMECEPTPSFHAPENVGPSRLLLLLPTPEAPTNSPQGDERE